MTPPVLSRAAQLHESSELNCDTITTSTSWEYVSKSSSLSDLTRIGRAFASTSEHQAGAATHSSNHRHSHQANDPRLLLQGILPILSYSRKGHDHHFGQEFVHSEANSEKHPHSSRRTRNKEYTNNPVLRSASFSSEYSAKNKPSLRYRQSLHAQAPPPPRPVKPAAVTERQEFPSAFAGIGNTTTNRFSCNVPSNPVEGEVYSLPVDSILQQKTSSDGNSHKMHNQRLETKQACSIKVPSSSSRSEHTSRRQSKGDAESTTQSRQLKHTNSSGNGQQSCKFSLRSSLIKDETCSSSTSIGRGSEKMTQHEPSGSKPEPHPQNGRRNFNKVSTSPVRSPVPDCNDNDTSIASQSSEQESLPGISKKSRSRSVDPSSLHVTEHNLRSTLRPASPSHASESCESFSSAEPAHRSENQVGDDPKDFSDKRNHTRLNFLNLFRRQKPSKPNQMTKVDRRSEEEFASNSTCSNATGLNFSSVNKEDNSYFYRELPPPPPGQSDSASDEEPSNNPVEFRDFAASIEKVKDCGWYWGPLASESAEELLSSEPDGSFIVRDSSDARYIFSLTFKLHGLVRHVRIEHDQGNFSFGPLTRFKASTIVDFVEKAVAHSRSGRYLFFLHRRPVLGPMQVQLLHPYSRFMHSRSLKHMCRFVILKYVRRDLIHTLPLPKPLQDYLNTPHYYFEHLQA